MPSHDDDNFTAPTESPRLISYRLGKLEEAVAALVQSTRELQTTFVRQDAANLRDSYNEKRFREIEDRLDKFGRAGLTILTTVISLVLVAIITYFIFGGPR